MPQLSWERVALMLSGIGEWVDWESGERGGEVAVGRSW
jgi:hypothetical protein